MLRVQPSAAQNGANTVTDEETLDAIQKIVDKYVALVYADELPKHHLLEVEQPFYMGQIWATLSERGK